MKLRNVAAFSLLGMVVCGTLAYVATPDGGLGGAAIAATGDYGFGRRDDDTRVVNDGTELGRFTSASTLMLEGRAGHPRILRGSSGQTFALLEITGAGEGGRVAAPAAGHLSILVDRSGSMRGTRIRNALSAATKAVQHLRDGDSVSIVAFDQKSKVIVPRTVIDASSRPRVLAGIDRIGLGGDTCMSCGISDRKGDPRGHDPAGGGLSTNLPSRSVRGKRAHRGVDGGAVVGRGGDATIVSVRNRITRAATTSAPWAPRRRNVRSRVGTPAGPVLPSVRPSSA